jgi:hypothetical protein
MFASNLTSSAGGLLNSVAGNSTNMLGNLASVVAGSQPSTAPVASAAAPAVAPAAAPAQVQAPAASAYSPETIVQLMTQLNQNPVFIEQLAKTLKDPLYESTLKLSTEREEQIAQIIQLSDTLKESIKGKSDGEDLKLLINKYLTDMDVIISKEKLFANAVNTSYQNEKTGEDKPPIVASSDEDKVETTLPSEDDYLKEASLTVTPVAETSATVTPSAETPTVEEKPVAETPAPETPTVEETPAQETQNVEEKPIEEKPVETLAAETPTVEKPIEEKPVEVTPPQVVPPPVTPVVVETPAAEESKVTGGKRPRRPTRRRSSSRAFRKTQNRKRNYR